MSEKLKGRVRVFCCGGAGINIGKMLEEYRTVEEFGVAKVEIVYVDTSRSNLTADLPESSAYLLKDLDGSGKIRKENHEQIAKHTRDVLQHYPGLDVNVVISSASGGSGSVIAPSLVSELLDQDLPVIVITIGSTDTRLEIDNTLKTIKSYDAISKLRNKPVVMAYSQNSKDTPRATVDLDVIRLLTAIMTMYSRENSELDSKDLFNFLRFERVTSYTPQLAYLTLKLAESPDAEAATVISVATLLTVGSESALPFTPDYQCVGYFPPDINPKFLNMAPIHLVAQSNHYPVIAKKLTDRLAELEKAQNARVESGKILGDRDQATDTGLIL